MTFDPELSPDSIQEQIEEQKSTLPAFFAANASNDPNIHEVAYQLTYQEFPLKFVWNATHRKWTQRVHQGSYAIGRMHFVSPNAGEQFYLHTLLTVVKGPTSYADLYKYNNVIYPTYYEACLARALLQDDGEWRQCLSESSEMKTGRQLRRLFVTILTCCAPSDPAGLWNEFRHYITDDIVPKLHTLGITNPSLDDRYDYGLYLLDMILAETGKSLHQNYPSMPHSQRNWVMHALNPLITNQLDYNQEAEKYNAEVAIEKLNSEQ